MTKKIRELAKNDSEEVLQNAAEEKSMQGDVSALALANDLPESSATETTVLPNPEADPGLTASIKLLTDEEALALANAQPSVATAPTDEHLEEARKIREARYRDVMAASIARICHEVNRVYCMSLGDPTQTSWEKAPEWQRKSAVRGVLFHLAHPEATAAASHESWLAEKEEDGWTYGLSKDLTAKTHPCFVAFEALPKEQQFKDVFFKAVVDACRPEIQETIAE